MEKHKGVYRILGSLLALPVLGGYVLALFMMAGLMIALTNEPVFTVSQDAYSTLGYHRLVELETKKLRATGKVELPDIGKIDEVALFVEHRGKWYTAPHIHCGVWELKFTPEQAYQLAGRFGCWRSNDQAYRHTDSPATTFDDTTVRLLGRQHGHIIEVLGIADYNGHYDEHLVLSPVSTLVLLALCLLEVAAMAGVWWLFRRYPRQSFLPVCMIALALLIIPAAILVWTGIVVHADEAPAPAPPLFIAAAIACIVYAARRMKGS
jgi:hypothetical protein